MLITEPRLEDRKAQHTMGIRMRVPMQEMQKVIPQLLDEVFSWLGKQGVEPAGPPFIRFHVIDMQGKMDIELGVPIAGALVGDGRISAGILPAGRYATLVYTGVKNGIEANKALIEWAAKNGIMWDRWDDENGDAFGGRYESYLTDPDHEADQTKWETEVAIRLADK